MTAMYVMAAIGLFAFGGLSIVCFRASRDDGDHTPQGNMARCVAFFVGFCFAALALVPFVDLAQHWLTD